VSAGGSLEQLRERNLARAEEHEQAARDLMLQVREHEQKAKACHLQAERESRGLEGERVVGAVLDELGAAGWRVFHDRRLPGSVANIDHIAVGPGGIVAIDAKAYRGQAVIVGDELRVGGRRRVNELDAVIRYARTVAATVRAGMPHLGTVVAYPVICFSGSVALPMPVTLRDVTLIEHGVLGQWMRSLPPFLPPQLVWQIGEVIEVGHPPRTGPPASRLMHQDRRPERAPQAAPQLTAQPEPGAPRSCAGAIPVSAVPTPASAVPLATLAVLMLALVALVALVADWLFA